MRMLCFQTTLNQPTLSTGSLNLLVCVHSMHKFHILLASVCHLLTDGALCATGGWNQQKKKLRKATVIPNEDASARHFGEGRVSHLYTFCANSMLQPGQADSHL